MFDLVKKFLKKEERKVTKRTAIPEAVKCEVLNKQNHRCAMCGKPLTVVCVLDHKVPVALGGTSEISNIQALCPDCHSYKTKYDRMLISASKEMPSTKKKVIFETLKRGWLFIGESPANANAVPDWLISNLRNFKYVINPDGYPYTFIRGNSFEYLVIMYKRGNYLFFKRFRSNKKTNKKRNKRKLTR